MESLGLRALNGDPRQAQLTDDLFQERGATQQGLDQGNSQVGPGDRQDKTGKAGSRSDVTDRCTFRDDPGQADTVQEVPLPQARSFARTDQTAYDAIGCQQLGVPLRQDQALVRKRPPRRFRRGGRFT